MSAAAIPDLKRIRFFTGQRLTAQDTTDVQSANRELRWLHNRSLHGWGIGIGYGVTGEAGDTSVNVAPGYAIDCLGRELILTSPVVMTVPAVAGISSGTTVTPATFFITASYLGDIAQATAESRPGVCLPGGTVRLTEGPIIQWQQLKDIRDGLNIILAEASVLNCQLNAPLDLDVRRSARPSQQPYISAGQLTPAAVTWAPVPTGIRTRVDTSAAKFQATPAYFAHVMGSREISIPQPGAPDVEILLITAVIIDNAAPDEFFCDVLLLSNEPGKGVVPLDPSLIPAVTKLIRWTVVWMGVEG